MVPIKCDVHSWMSTYIGVLSHPYFVVTGSDGAFDLSKLPAGTYTIEAWHEKYCPPCATYRRPCPAHRP